MQKVQAEQIVIHPFQLAGRSIVDAEAESDCLLRLAYSQFSVWKFGGSQTTIKP